jgi:hypothetical protein
MDGITSFFAKYNAMPADRNGPRWCDATPEALERELKFLRGVVVHGWFAQRPDTRNLSDADRLAANMSAIESGREATAAERTALRPQYAEALAEVRSRAKRPGCPVLVLTLHWMSAADQI